MKAGAGVEYTPSSAEAVYTYNMKNGSSSWSMSAGTVPLPGTLALLGIGLIGGGFLRRRSV